MGKNMNRAHSCGPFDALGRPRIRRSRLPIVLTLVGALGLVRAADTARRLDARSMLAQADARAPRDQKNQKDQGGTIRGRVFALDTGRPLRKATVRLALREPVENRAAITDTEG